MKVAVTGSTGFIGRTLVGSLRDDGHQVIRLVRRQPQGPDEAHWEPAAGMLDPAVLEGVDAVVHLSGASVARRISGSYKKTFYDSRVDSTRLLARRLAELRPGPRVLISQSGTGFYGDTAGPTDEDGPGEYGFFSQLVRDWEQATGPAAEAGVRVALTRSGPVVGAGGGVVSRISLPFRLGLGGRLGSGRQYWSFVSLADQVGAIRFLLDRDELAGPVNVTMPETPTNAELTRAFGRALHRPTPFPVPRFALRVMLGEFAHEVLMSQQIVPRRLLDAGFTFRHRDADALAEYAFGRR